MWPSKDVDAPLKLVIAGNHDWTLDEAAFGKKVAEIDPPADPALVEETYGCVGQARQMFEQAKEEGIVFLDEGTHEFTLQNGASLTVYASPFTPQMGQWGFQYPPNQGHSFDMTKGIDVVMTHGPPQGVMDRTVDKERAGCPDLFAVIARARPRLHCFGHIHEVWGAKLVTWRDQPSERPSHFTDIDNSRSTMIESLLRITPSTFDTPEAKLEKENQLDSYREEGCCHTSHCVGDSNPLDFGMQTLFVNASIEGTEQSPIQIPWLVDIELQPAD